MSRPRSRSGSRASLIALAAVAGWLGACGTGTTSPEPDRNRSPLVVDAIPATDVPIGQLANVDVTPYFRDPDGDALTFTAVSGDPLVARVSVSGSVVTLEGRSRGTAAVAVTANDGDGLSATQRFEVTAGAALTFALGVAQAIEGVDARLEVVLAEAATAPLTLSYTLGLDASHLTDDAEAADYFANGSVEVPAGASGTTIAITVVDDDEIEPPIEVFTVSLDRPDNETGYVLASPSSAVVVIREGVCDRTPQVRDGIVERLRVDLCSDPDQQDLARLKALPLKWDEDGDGIDYDEIITELNEDDFRNLPGLEWLSLQGNRLTELPENIFSDLSSLEVVDLSGNELTRLPPGLFAGLRRLGWISLFDNRLAELPPSLFQGLAALRELYLGDNELTSLPPGVFSGLFRLETLGLAGNRVAFAFQVRLARGDGEDSTAPGSAELEARMLEGAPFTMMLPLSARGGTLSVDSILLRAGSTASARVRLTPDDGSDAPISVTIGTGDALSDICVDRCDGFDIVAGDPLVVANPESVALSVPTAYVTQATQSREGEVPLVAGRRSLLRVFATADEVNSFRASARATFFRGEVETHRVALEPPTGGIPLEVDESRLGRSFNAIIPGHVLEPGLSMVVEMDPDGTVPLTSESQPRFPAQGRYDLGVRDVPPLHMTLVPVQYHTEANRDVNPGVADFAAELVAAASGAGSALARSVLRYTRTVLPIGDLSLALREPYFTWADTTEAGVAGLLGEIELLRTMEAKDDNEYYSGIFGVPAPSIATRGRILDRRSGGARRPDHSDGIPRGRWPAPEGRASRAGLRARTWPQSRTAAYPLRRSLDGPGQSGRRLSLGERNYRDVGTRLWRRRRFGTGPSVRSRRIQGFDVLLLSSVDQRLQLHGDVRVPPRTRFARRGTHRGRWNGPPHASVRPGRAPRHDAAAVGRRPGRHPAAGASLRPTRALQTARGAGSVPAGRAGRSGTAPVLAELHADPDR
ncbi:Ig-like domain-containing protein [Candidatus Palauibacter sp.]|uniref:Ig-like domain-containing protein n=1 Tax=Candidatus Palauibacter sp. TaxID=3101350 RepID=UPI003AF2F3CC